MNNMPYHKICILIFVYEVILFIIQIQIRNKYICQVCNYFVTKIMLMKLINASYYLYLQVEHFNYYFKK